MYIDRERASFAKIQRKRIPDTWDMCRSSGMTEKLQGVLYSLHRGGRRREGGDKFREPSRDRTMQGFVDEDSGFKLYSESNKKSERVLSRRLTGFLLCF